MSKKPVMIKAANVEKWFGSHKVLDKVSFEVRKGEVIAIIGPSGSGKSTFLRCLNGLETINGGCIEIEGELFAKNENGHHTKIHRDKIRSMTKKIGMVFQHFNLFPHLTVIENITEAPPCGKRRIKRRSGKNR